jgi:V/A-type H+/Na+-transporting ATPase subunit A
MIGAIRAVFGNMVAVEAEGEIVQSSVAHCCRSDGARLTSEVIRVRGRHAELQVFEETRGLRVGDRVEFGHELLSVTLGPGLLGQIYDGLQNPLPELARSSGFFLKAGELLPGLPQERRWRFTPRARPGDVVQAGDVLGSVPESIVEHAIMVPLAWQGRFTVASVAEPGHYPVTEVVALLGDAKGVEHEVRMQQRWPVKVPLAFARRRLMPTDPLVTRVRIIDSMFPIVRGGTYCIPGPVRRGQDGAPADHRRAMPRSTS